MIDTNVVSDYLSASLPTKGLELMDLIINAIPKISIITQIELLCWNTDPYTSQNIKDFIQDCIIYDITPAVVTHCVFLRKNRKIKTPDATIAVSALAHNLTLVTNNEKDFINIKGLKVLNPNKLQ
ncbi:MAG: type II toxin-antitoxin system VapC family toxin [Runella sp.]